MEESEIKKLQLELGGSVFELIEFALTRKINGQTIRGLYGVNVAKVREVVRMPKINSLASRHKGIAGLFELRGIPIPAINLAVTLGDETGEIRSNQQIIVTEFSQKRAGFIVDTTHRIRRIAWEKVLPPSADPSSCMSGMTLVEDNEFLFILDLEKILLNLEFGESYVNSHSQSSQPQPYGVLEVGRDTRPMVPSGVEGHGNIRILLIDDSAFIRSGCKQMLVKSGFQVVEAGDGAEALQMLEATTTDNGFDLIVSDIEMPRMDGLSLTKKLREHPRFNEMPIILHTSLSGKANQVAGLAVGANGYVIKNDFLNLFKLISELLGPDALGKKTA